MNKKTEQKGSITGIIRIALCVVVLFSVIPSSWAQEAKVRFSKKNITIVEGFNEISRQAGMHFVVNLSTYDFNQKVNIAQKDNTIPQALDILLAGTGMTYEISNKHIMIVPKKVDNTPANTVITMPKAPVRQNTVVMRTDDLDRNIEDYEALRAAAANKQPKTTTVDRVVEQIIPGQESNFSTYPEKTLNLTRTGISAYDVIQRETPRIAMKTNLLYLGTTATPNLGLEIGLGRRSTLDITGSYNPWNLKGSYEDNKKLVHWIVGTEYRYWLCERFNGHFFGAKIFYSNYNVSQYDIPLLFEKEYRYEGYAAGAGISWGYHLMLGKHWGLEFNAGVGAAYMSYTKKDCIKCGSKVGDYTKTYYGPTSLGIKLVYVIK